MIIVSVIIPIYNVDKYLVQCLDSVERQNYSKLQVVLVNDGSTDNSLSICQKYVEKHPDTWILINQGNAGLSAARNAGLDHASGDCIAFLDSDDWIDEDFISNLVNYMEKTNADIVDSGIRWCYSDSYKVDSFADDGVYDAHIALGHYLLQTLPIHSAVCCKLYKKDIFKNNRFEVGRLHEDGFFLYQAMYDCKKYGVLKYTGYNYRQNREGSIMTATVKPKNITDVMDMMELRVLFFKNKKEPVLAEKAASYYYRTALTNYITAKKTIKDDELSEKIRRKLYASKKQIFNNRYLGVKNLKFLFFFLFPTLFVKRY